MDAPIALLYLGLSFQKLHGDPLLLRIVIYKLFHQDNPNVVLLFWRSQITALETFRFS